MLKPVVLAFTLTCSQTQFVNYTSDEFNSHDYRVYKTAKKRCKNLYPDAPCVKVFIKKYSISNDKSIHYNVICSEKEMKFSDDKRNNSHDHWKTDIGNESMGIRDLFCSDKRNN